MDLLASGHEHPDVLDGEAVRTVRRRPSRKVLLAAGAAALAGALAVPLVLELTRDPGPGPAAPEALSGSLLLRDGRSTPVELTFGDQQERAGFGTGPVHLELADRTLDGLVFADFSASFDGVDDHESSHLRGDIRLVFGSNECRGSFGWSNFSPPEGGGSLHARCEDGATLAATLAATPQLPGAQGMSIHLRDGWYVGGPRD